DPIIQARVAAYLADAVAQFFMPRGNAIIPAIPAFSLPPPEEADIFTWSYYLTAVARDKALGHYQPLDTFVNGQKIIYDVRPLLLNNRTMVPIRAVTEALGAEVVWS